ncbi:sensor histidine kinase [Pontibacter pamirensis]|uniref:sensor histidine kinase n=1 Tax=Pontibacter pamirensis TaxID=2562824 RepID=UPI0013898BFF|nr:PAS domain-containing sensor histidine kinase [Pontibacter pamirensis]
MGVQAREELIRQQEYLKEVFQQAPVGIAIVRGPHYILDLANPEVCQIWGRNPEDVLGKPVVEALPEIADQGIIQLLDNVVDTGEPFIAHELPLLLERNGNREKVYLNFLYHPLRNSQGGISGVIAVAIDISQQVKFRQSVEALNEELMVTNTDLDNFVYAASHDLRAPISNIEGLMLALVDEMPVEVLESETVKHVLDLIQGSVNRFKRTVTDLSNVAKVQRHTDKDMSNIDLAGIVAEVLLDLEPLIIAADAQVVTDLAPDAVIVHFSAKNMKSIVYNLLSNALKYSAPERRPHIIVTAKRAPGYVLLSVKDNGLGMDMAEEYKMFSMFKRLHDHMEGSGVGLYIVKRIVENAGGSIEVGSEVGVGSTFIVSFKC